MAPLGAAAHAALGPFETPAITLVSMATVGLVAQLPGLAYIARQVRESIRIGRAGAALVDQEEEKARALIREATGPHGAA